MDSYALLGLDDEASKCSFYMTFDHSFFDEFAQRIRDGPCSLSCAQKLKIDFIVGLLKTKIIKESFIPIVIQEICAITFTLRQV